MAKFRMIGWSGLVALAVLAMAPAAQAQTVYAPPRIQYGPAGEIFYSGSDANIQQGGTNLYAPQWLWYASEGRIIPPSYVRRHTDVDRRGWREASPFHREGPFFFSDRYPNLELGQYGYNADDIRNDAYAKLPRISAGPMPQFMTSGSLQQMQQAAQPTGRVAVAGPINSPQKAIPLLSMARSAHRQGNRQLVDALLYEAAKYDADAVARFRRSL